MAAAKLTRMEMDTLIAIGVDPRVAWSDCATLFCLAPPPPPPETPSRTGRGTAPRTGRTA